MSGDDKTFDRRSVLKTIGATAVVGAGLGATTTSAAAKDDEFARNYADENRLRFAFEQHGEGLRQNLAEEGFVSEDFDFWSLDFEIDDTVEGLEPKAEDRLAGVSSLLDHGAPTAWGMVSTSSATHEISMFVQPERDEAYALVEPKDSDDRFLVTNSEVSPQGCSYTGCSTDCCAEEEAYEYTYNCDPNCENCYVYSKSCSCFTYDC